MAKDRRDPHLRIPPQSLDSEKAVLGSVMMRAGSMHEINELLVAEDFYSERHQIIYRTMAELSQRNEPIDLLSLSTRLKEKEVLEQTGGSAYLTELTASVPSSTNVVYYAEIVHKKATLRNLITAGDSVAELGFKETELPISDVLDTAEKTIFGVTQSVNKKHNFVGIKESLTQTFEQLNKLIENKGEVRGIPSGYQELDGFLAGFQRSDLIIIAARPSVGKTTLALDIARRTATEHNSRVGIFSLEMSSQQLASRLLSSESRVSAWSIRTGQNLKDQDFLQIRESLDKLSKAPIYIDDQAGNSINQMRAAARRLKSQYGLDMIIVDYLQLMTTAKNHDSMVNQVTEISRSLKQLARELDVPVIALSQLSRAVEQRGGKPRLSDLRDSGSIEQDADVVMFIHREDKYKDESERTNIAEILIEKHRNGPTGSVQLYFDGNTTSFLPLEKSNLADFSSTGGTQKNALDEF